MSTTIQIKRSSTALAVPLSGDLAVGELAVNLADKRLFAKQADGTIIELSTNPTDLDAATLRIDGVEITASATELNSLDGLTATTAELNILDGVTATTAELNFVDGVTSNVQTQLNAKQPLDAQLTDIAGLTPTDGSFIVGNGTNFVAESGNTAIASLGVTATAAELNTLDGVTASTTELNYTDGVTSNIQTQLNSKAATTTSPTITLAGDLSGSATLTNLGSATLTATVADDSHNHVISNVDGLQTALDSKANLSGANFTGSVDVTGTITADGLTVDGAAVISGVANANLQLTSTGGNTYQLRTDVNSAYIYQANRAVPIAQFGYGGDVSFYEDTGTTAKMVWDASAESLTLPDLKVSGGVYLGGTGAANKLDDYEEGLWTPAITTNTPPSTVTHSIQDGYYVKVGKLVTVNFDVQLSSWSGGSNFVFIDDLPFVTNDAVGMGSLSMENVSITSTSYGVSPRSSVQNHLIIRYDRDNNTSATLLAGNLSGNERFRGSFSYTTNS